jgi:hypothetical protein
VPGKVQQARPQRVTEERPVKVVKGRLERLELFRSRLWSSGHFDNLPARSFWINKSKSHS